MKPDTDTDTHIKISTRRHLAKLVGAPLYEGDTVKIDSFVYLVTSDGVKCLGRQQPGVQGRQGIKPL